MQFIICGSSIVFAQVPEIINIESGMNNPGNLVLSDIAYEIKYIPLETDEYNLIGNVNKIKFNDDYIFVQDGNPPSLHVFDHNGKYIRKIGKHGRGPNEFSYLNDFTFSNIKPRVWLLTSIPYKIIEYNLNGSFVKQIEYSMSDNYNRIEFLFNNKYLIMRTNSFGNTPFTFSIFSEDGKHLKNAILPEQFEYSGSVSSSKNNFWFNVFNNNCYVMDNVLNDTLYRISSSLEFLPKYIFDSGKYRQTLDFRQNFTEYYKRKDLNYIIHNTFFETSKVLIYCYLFKMNSRLNYYDKTLKKSYTFKNKGIPNDLDGGFDFIPEFQINDLIIGYISVLELKDYVASDIFKNSTPKYPEKKKELERLAKSLDENDNPVLMLVKLKE
jgi:hypothetical protein